MEILNWRDVIGKPSVIAEFDLYFPDWRMTIYNFKVIRTKKGKCFATAPAYMREIGDSKKFYPYVTFSLEKQQEFNLAVNELLKPYLGQG